MTWLRPLGPSQPSPIAPVASVAEGDLTKRNQVVEAVDEDHAEGKERRRKVVIPKKVKEQVAYLKELLQQAASRQFLYLFFQARRPLKSRRFPKKFREREKRGLFYREVRPLSAKRFVELATEVFLAKPQEKMVTKKKVVTKDAPHVPSLLSVALDSSFQSLVLQRTMPLEHRFWFCLNDALHKYAQSVDRKTKGRF